MPSMRISSLTTRPCAGFDTIGHLPIQSCEVSDARGRLLRLFDDLAQTLNNFIETCRWIIQSHAHRECVVDVLKLSVLPAIRRSPPIRHSQSSSKSSPNLQPGADSYTPNR